MDQSGVELERYRTLVETVGDPMYMLDGDGTITAANRAMADALGHGDPRAVEGEPVTAFMPPADVERGTEVLLDLVGSDREWASFEMELVTAGGERIEAEDKVAPLTEDGELVGSVGVIRDISDQKRRQRELRELNERIERLQSFFTELQAVTTVPEVYDLAIEAAVDILGLDWCTIAIAEEGWLELKAVSETAPVDVGDRHLRVDEGSGGRVYQTGEAHIVRDSESEGKPADDSIRSGLTVPLGDRGIFQATAGTPDAFDGNDLELAELLAGHTAEALDRVERERELRDLNEKVSSLHEFTTDLHAAGDVDAVYDRCIEAAEDILAFDSSVVAVATDGWFEIRAVSADSPLSAGERHLRVDEGIAGEAYASGESRLVTGEGDAGAPVDSSFRSNITVPIGDRGVFQASSTTVGYYDEDDLELAELLASHVTEALGRVEREQELRALTGKVEQLHRVTSSLQSCTTPEEIYELVVDAAEDILAFDWSVVAIAEEGWLELKAVSDDAPIEAGARHLQVDEGVAGKVYQHGEARMINHPSDDPAAEPVDESFTANVTVPLGDHGVFQANAAEAGYFDEDDLELAELLAGHAGEALRRVDRERALREREQELRRQNERLERFASVVSHDLRNPLNVAQGYVESIDDDAAREVERSLDRMEAIVEEVLELARQGRTIDDPEAVGLAGAARDAWANVDTGDATLAVDADATVRADEGRLVALLENLFRNAVEHGGADTVTVEADPEAGRIAVADDGRGIPADRRDAVFEMGFTTSEDGTGFGLAIVEEVASAHGWDVSVDDGPDGGARFSFSGVEWASADA